MALVQESSEEVEEINIMSTSKQVEESSKEVEESSESDEITISERCWANCKNEALYFGYSPLFIHLAAGSLDDKEFYQYVANHEHLLYSFLEVYKLAADQCEDVSDKAAFLGWSNNGSLDDKEFYQYVANHEHLLYSFLEVYKLTADQCEDVSDKAAFLGWSNNVEQELERHNSFVESKLGLIPTKEITLHPATAKYKEFLLATASGNVQVSEIPIHQSKIPAYTLGAMTPSLRIYAFLSKAMQKLVSAYVDSHPYSKWFKEYFYESFETPYLHSEDVLDELCDSLTDKEVEVVERLYCQAMRLEMDFFYSRQSEQTLIIPICTKLDPKEERLMLFADFDFTCTSVASLEILANIEILTAQKPDRQLLGEDRDGHSQVTSIDLRKTWELLSQQYTSENDNFIEKIMLGEKALSFNYHGLHSALVELSSSEEQVVTRIFDSGVLKGISLEDIKQAGKCMELHNGCLNFFEKVKNLDVSVTVMSCWSGDLTRSALSGIQAADADNGYDEPYSPFLNVGKIAGSKPFVPNVVTRYFHPTGGAKKLKLGVKRPAAVGPYRCKHCNREIAPDGSLNLCERQVYGLQAARTLYKSTERLQTVNEGESSTFLWEDPLSLSQVHMKEVYLICGNQECRSLIGFRYHEANGVTAPGSRKRKLSLVSFTPEVSDFVKVNAVQR
ncbi:hypothetical protein MKX03_012947 [Papaver bracteatum]|nr:hypothetical protein MKX03_012947 [Papaver bracteatum]